MGDILLEWAKCELNNHIRYLSFQVESCLSSDVTWGLGYDSTPWVYTGGWGGGHFKVSIGYIGVEVNPV